MARAPWTLLLAACLGGCDLLDALEPDVPNCDPRKPYWVDADGDGFGDPGTVYLGCQAPDGYTDVPPASDTDAPDTDAPDTDAPDTDPSDTDAPDTDPSVTRLAR